jgi:hypothetical protein
MGFNCFLSVLKDLFLKPIPQIKDDIVCVCLDGKREEVDVKLNSGISEILKCQSELPAHDEDLDCLGRDQELIVGFKELDDMLMRKHDRILTVELVSSLVEHQDRDEIHKHDMSLLVEVNLSPLDLDQLVTDIFVDVKIDFVLEHVVNHLVVVCFQQL